MVSENEADPFRYVISVRALCDLTARIGDLDQRFTPSPTALEGMVGHNTVTSRRPPGYLTEIPLTGEYKNIFVRGRADGYDPQDKQLEEIKTFKGLLERTRIYATDINDAVLKQARAGIFPLNRMQEYTENYIRAGGKRSFSEYYTAKYDGALFSPSLSRNIVFSQHNLVTDRSFAEFTVIFCRNVLIYFDRALQDRVHSLFYDSLVMFGILALGSKESLRFSQYEPCYEKLHPREKLYRKIR